MIPEEQENSRMCIITRRPNAMKQMLLCACVVDLLSLRFSPAQSDAPTDTSYRLYITQLAAAEAFLQLNQISTAKSYLDACERRHRDLEWRFLNAHLDQSLSTTAKSTESIFTTIQMSPDGKVLAAAGSDSTITLHTHPGLKPLRELKGHTASVSTLAFSNDSRRLASGGRDHAVILWDVTTGRQICRNDKSFSQGIYQVRFSPDDSLLGVVSWERLPNVSPPVNGFVKTLATTDAREVKKIDTDSHPAAGVVFTPDGKNVIVSTWGEILYSFEATSGKLNWSYDLSDPAEYNAFHSIDLSPDGKTVAVGSTDHRIHLLNSADGRLVRRIEPWQGHAKTVKAVKFSNDGKWISSAGEDQTILIWNADGFRKHRSLIGHIRTVTGLSWTPDGNTLFSSSMDGTVKEWDPLRGFAQSYDICNFGPWQSPLTPDGQFFAAPCSDRNLAIYEIASGKPLVNFGAQSGLCADISKDTRWLVTASFDGVVRLWDVSSGEEKRAFTGHIGRVDGIAFLNSKKQIVSVGDTTLRVWSVQSTKEVRSISFTDYPFRVILHPDESLAYVGFGTGKVKSFDTRSWIEVGSFDCSNGLQEMAMSPDGRLLAVFSGKNVEVWDTRTSRRTHLLTGHEQSGYGIGFSPDSRYLVSGSSDQTFKFWNLTNGICTFTYHGYEDVVYSCKFPSDNELLIGTSQGKIRYYRF